MKRKSLILALLLAVLGGVSFLTVSLKNTSGFKTYIDPIYGFTVNIPSDWHDESLAITVPSTTLIKSSDFNKEEPTQDVYGNLAVLSGASFSIDGGGVAEGIIKNSDDYVSFLKRHKNGETISLGGEKALLTSPPLSEVPGSWGWRTIQTLHSGREFQIIFEYSNSVPTTTRERILSEFIRSFRFSR